MKQHKNFFRVLRVLHLGMLCGTCLFAIISLIVINRESITTTEESLNRTLQVTSVFFSFTLLLIGFNLFKKKLVAVRNSLDHAERRMNQYITACITWWAMIEVPALFAVSCYWLTANLSFFFLASFHIFILFVFMPRKENIIVLLKLNSQEVMRLEGRA